jgi:hypothetical protein
MKTKVTTFDELMLLKTKILKKQTELMKLKWKEETLVCNFPECYNKLMQYNNVKYVVTKKSFAFLDHKKPELNIIKIDDGEEDE